MIMTSGRFLRLEFFSWAFHAFIALISSLLPVTAKPLVILWSWLSGWVSLCVVKPCSDLVCWTPPSAQRIIIFSRFSKPAKQSRGELREFLPKVVNMKSPKLPREVPSTKKPIFLICLMADGISSSCCMASEKSRRKRKVLNPKMSWRPILISSSMAKDWSRIGSLLTMIFREALQARSMP